MIFGLSPFDIIGILIFILLILFLPIIMRARMISSVAKTVEGMEEVVKEAQNIVVKISKEKGKPATDPTDTINNFMDFFVVPPVNLDPNGLIQRFEKILDLGEERFRDIVEIIAPRASEEEKSNIVMVLKATIGLNNIAKLVKHNLELARKTGNLQILLSLQMNLPLIMGLFKAQTEGAKSFSKGYPVGDGVGPLISSMLMNNIVDGKIKETELEYHEDMVVFRKTFQNRNLTIIRAKGPGGRIGKLSKVALSTIDKNNIDRIITIDAAAKLEGEKTGRVAEGVGIAIGGLGIEKWMIEEKVVSTDMKIDSIIVKMSSEEAIKQMTPEILKGAKEALISLKKSVLRSPENSNILVIGVGNSCGIPNINIDNSQIQIKKIKDSSKSNSKKLGDKKWPF